MDTDLVYSAIRISTPLIYAALGGLLTYQAGILNIALDGFMIVAAFAAIAVAYATESLALGVLAGIVSAMALAALLAVFNLRLRANIFIAGIAVTFLAAGAKRSESGQKRRRLPGRARLEQECRKAVG